MFNKLSAIAAGSLALGTIAISPVSYADPPHRPGLIGPMITTAEYGQVWHMEVFRDTNSLHSAFSYPFDICFYNSGTNGTHQTYKWFFLSPQTPWWWKGKGTASQEGDQIFMSGGFRISWSNQDFSNYMQWQIASKDLGTGHWRYWNSSIPSAWSAWFQHLNIIMTRLNKVNEKCKKPDSKEAAAEEEVAELPVELRNDPEAMELLFGPDVEIDEDEVDVEEGDVGSSDTDKYPNPTYKFDSSKNTGVLTLPTVDFQTLNPLFPKWSTQEDAFSAILELVPGTSYFHIIEAESKE
jgi:hypothetical protein